MALGGLVSMLIVVALFGYFGAAVAGATLGTGIIVGVVAMFVGPKVFKESSSSEVAEPPHQMNNSKAAIRATKKRRTR